MKPPRAESSPVLPSDALVPLESVLCTEELDRRPFRPPDYERENRALVVLVQALVESPGSILQALADTILEVLQADSAGISLLTKDEKRFHWPAIAGTWQPHIGGGTPRDFGPCGDVLDRNAPLLFRHPEQRYTYFLPVKPPVIECLLVPFYVEQKAVGTIWAIAQNDLRKFDAEDMRQLSSLGTFASSAYQAVASLEDALTARSNALSLMEEAVRSRQVMEMLNEQLRERTTELEVTNRTLAHELSERQQVEDRLRQLTNTLEERVNERTHQLSTSYERLRALATDLTVAEQSERRRLATQLHDYLAQLLVVIRMKLGQLLRQDHDAGVLTLLHDADQLLLQSLDYTRSLVSELVPQALYERGLSAALQWLGDQMSRQQMLNVEVALDAPELLLPEADAVLLFHSIRELLFNVLKHGKTDQASVSMRYDQNVVSIIVSDHGCGFDVARLRDDHSDRFGLLSIQERMMAIGGRFHLESEPGKGTVASLHLPSSASGEGIESQVAGGEEPA